MVPNLTIEDKHVLVDLRKTRAKALGVKKDDLCLVCTEVIKMQIFKGTDFCSELCRKEWNGELDQPMAVAYL